MRYYPIIIALIFLGSTITADAQSMMIDTAGKELRLNDTTVLKVYLNTNDQEINAIDGKMKIDGPVEIVSMNTAGSVMQFWPGKPSWDKNYVSYVGGSPDPVFGTKLKLFNIALRPISSGRVKITFEDNRVFLSDGEATSIKLDPESQIIEILGGSITRTNELAQIIADDKDLPNEFRIEIGKDNTTFDGQYFLSFNATDDDSGVQRYEVKEGNNPRIRTGTTYILQDQSLKTPVTVYAIDNAGNERAIEFEYRKPISIFTIILSAVALLLLIYTTLYLYSLRKSRQRKRHWR